MKKSKYLVDRVLWTMDYQSLNLFPYSSANSFSLLLFTTALIQILS